MRKIKLSWIGIVAIVLAAVAVCGLTFKLTNGFETFNPSEVFAAKPNTENLFYDKIEDREIYDNYQIDTVAKDGVITLNGKIAAVDATGLTFSDPIEVVTLTLKKGTYTFSCFENPTVKSYFAVGQYKVAGATHTWLADFEKVPGIDLGTDFGTVHERTLTLDADTEITFKIMIAEGAELDDVEAQFCIVEGEEEGKFYLDFLA